MVLVLKHEDQRSRERPGKAAPTHVRPAAIA